MSSNPGSLVPMDPSAEPLLPVINGQAYPVSDRAAKQPGAEHYHAAPAVSFTLSTMLRALARRWVVALGLGLILGGSLFALIWFCSPPRFTATAVLRVSSSEEQVIDKEHVAQQETLEVYQHTQVMLIKSRPIVSEALKDDKARQASMLANLEDPVGWVVTHLSVYFYENTELLNISLTGTNPEELSAIVNAVEKAYRVYVANRESDIRQGRHNRLIEALATEDRKYREKRDRLNKDAGLVNAGNAETQAAKLRVAVEQYASFHRQLVEAQAKLRLANESLTLHQNKVKNLDKWRGYDIRLLSPLSDANGLPAKGKNLIVVAAVDRKLHFCIFDSEGNRVLETETGLKERAEQGDSEKPVLKEQTERMEELRSQLQSLLPPHELTATEKSSVKSMVASIVGQSPWTPPADLVEQQLDLHHTVVNLQLESDKLDEALKTLERKFVKPDSLSLTSARSDAQAARERLAAARDKLRPRIIEQIRNKVRADSSNTVEQLREEVARLEPGVPALQKAVKEQEGLIELYSKGDKGDPTSEDSRKELEALEALKTMIQGKIALLGIEIDAAKSGSNRVSLHQAAEVPRERNLQSQASMPGMVGGAAFFLMVGLVGLWECLQGKVSTEEDVKQGLRLSILGTVPRLPQRSPTEVLGGANSSRWQYALEGSMDGLRTVLLHHAVNSGERAVLITSAESCEGKSSLAANLGLSMARSGRKTLLIDGDLRRPVLNRLFGVEGAGLCEVLRGEMSVAQAVHPTGVDLLSLLPAGQLDMETQRSLSKDGFRQVLSQLISNYDFVIIDASPVLRATEPLLLSRCVGTVVLAVRPGVSRIPLVHDACRRLTGLGVRVLGAVLNGFGSGRQYYPYGSQALEDKRKDNTPG